MWQLNGLVGIVSHVRVILATKDDGPTLMETETQASQSSFVALCLCESACVQVCVSVPKGLLHVEYVLPEFTDLAVICCRAFWHLL